MCSKIALTNLYILEQKPNYDFKMFRSIMNHTLWIIAVQPKKHNLKNVQKKLCILQKLKNIVKILKYTGNLQHTKTTTQF